VNERLDAQGWGMDHVPLSYHVNRALLGVELDMSKPAPLWPSPHVRRQPSHLCHSWLYMYLSCLTMLLYVTSYIDT
jgi:hypothetical protein